MPTAEPPVGTGGLVKRGDRVRYVGPAGPFGFPLAVLPFGTPGTVVALVHADFDAAVPDLTVGYPYVVRFDGVHPPGDGDGHFMADAEIEPAEGPR